MIAISGCLLGKNCRYDGGSRPDDDIIGMAAETEHIIICPESMGHLKSPRPPAEIIGGDGFDVLDGRAKVVDKNGKDVTPEFIKGAQAVLEACLKNRVQAVYLKEKSPSCGVDKIYDGTFSGVLRDAPAYARRCLLITVLMLSRYRLRILVNRRCFDLL